MIFPNYKEFCKFADEYEKITVYKEIYGDMLTPVTLLSKFSQEDYVFLLESVNTDKIFSRFSFIGKSPKQILIGKGNDTFIVRNGEKYKKSINITEYFKSVYEKRKHYSPDEFGDFSGGFVGYFGYESVNFMNVLRENIKMDNETNSAIMEIDKFYIFDNFKNKLYAAFVVDVDVVDLQDKYDSAVIILDKMIDEIFNIQDNIDNIGDIENFKVKQEYEKDILINKIKKVKEEIINGEAIQIVISQKYIIENKINPLYFYRALRAVNPSPYMFYLKFKDFYITGSSPETHLKVKNKIATLKPIAGTYPIGENIEKIKQELLEDEKERAEHLMLLDLARNDLYQGCSAESVQVKKAFTTEVYSHVIHIVSEVTGRLRNDITSFEMFLKTFPAGTVTGAPKVRAMEIIDIYENSVRGFYSGCVGYFGYNHNLDTCITIRSAFIDDKDAIFRAGAGIVAESDPENEYLEIDRKLKAMFKALETIKELR